MNYFRLNAKLPEYREMIVKCLFRKLVFLGRNILSCDLIIETFFNSDVHLSTHFYVLFVTRNFLFQIETENCNLVTPFSLTISYYA